MVLTAVEASRVVKVLVHGEAMPKRDVEVINLNESEQLDWAGGKAHARLGFDAGRASFGLLYSDANVGVPRHAHAESTEVVGLLSGDGTMGIGDEKRPVASGDVFHMPTGVDRHDYAPSGTTTLFAVQLYVPPGPEQRFKELAKEGGRRALTRPRGLASCAGWLSASSMKRAWLLGLLLLGASSCEEVTGPSGYLATFDDVAGLKSGGPVFVAGVKGGSDQDGRARGGQGEGRVHRRGTARRVHDGRSLRERGPLRLRPGDPSSSRSVG